MAIENLFESENIRIGYDTVEGWLFTDWIGFQSIDRIKNGGEKMLEYLKQTGASKVLNDNTHVSGAWGGAAEWAGTDWLPRMVEAGLVYFAWIHSPSALSRQAANLTVQSGSQHAEGKIHMFYDIDEAKSWLRSIK